MKRAPRQTPAGELKAKCLGVLGDVAASRHEVIVTTRGKPVASGGAEGLLSGPFGCRQADFAADRVPAVPPAPPARVS